MGMSIIGLPAVAIVAIVAYVFLAALGAAATIGRVSRVFWGSAGLIVVVEPAVGVIL